MLNRNTRALSSYSEAEINFFPTYKYVKRERVYDARRTPAWCDRILFYSKDKLKLKPLHYSDLDVYVSDHKPVCGTYWLMCKKEDKEEKKKLIQNYYESKWFASFLFNLFVLLYEDHSSVHPSPLSFLIWCYFWHLSKHWQFEKYNWSLYLLYIGMWIKIDG